MTLSSSIFQTKIDFECKRKLNEAQGTWSATQDQKGAEATINILADIDPQSSCYKEANDFMNLIYTEIKERIEEVDRREWELKLKMQQDAKDLESQRINAIKEVATAYAKNRPAPNYYVIY